MLTKKPWEGPPTADTHSGVYVDRSIQTRHHQKNTCPASSCFMVHPLTMFLCTETHLLIFVKPKIHPPKGGARSDVVSLPQFPVDTFFNALLQCYYSSKAKEGKSF